MRSAIHKFICIYLYDIYIYKFLLTDKVLYICIFYILYINFKYIVVTTIDSLQLSGSPRFCEKVFTRFSDDMLSARITLLSFYLVQFQCFFKPSKNYSISYSPIFLFIISRSPDYFLLTFLFSRKWQTIMSSNMKSPSIIACSANTAQRRRMLRDDWSEESWV